MPTAATPGGSPTWATRTGLRSGTPPARKIVFASNHQPAGLPSPCTPIGIDGTGLEKVSDGDTFDAFPVFSPDGRHLVFSSNRNNHGTRETNLFLAEWQE